MGKSWFDRLGREVEPTPVGRLLYSYASRILRLQQETLQAIVQYSGQFVGNLLIGASTIPGTYILPTILSAFRQQYPEIKATVPISGSRTVAQKVLDGEYDLGLVGAILNERGLEWQPLFPDTLVLVTSPNGFLRNRQSIPVSNILTEPFVFREQGSGTRKSIAQILESKGYKESDLHEVAQFGSNEAVKEAVKAGVGIFTRRLRLCRASAGRSGPGRHPAALISPISGGAPEPALADMHSGVNALDTGSDTVDQISRNFPFLPCIPARRRHHHFG